MTIEQLNNSKIPIIVFDKKLEQFRSKTLFPKKLAKANEILIQVGLPPKRNKPAKKAAIIAAQKIKAEK